MNVYIIKYADDHEIYMVYDEETFLKVWESFLVTPPLYSDTDFWKGCYVIRWKLNTEESEAVTPQDIKAHLANRRNQS